MHATTATFTSSDGVQLFIYQWLPDQPAKALIHIIHGMAEHAGRYARVGRILTEHGYAVYADDHRGHGRTVVSKEEFGHFADENGWNRVLEDFELLIESEAALHPELPIILFGHSMGSFFAQQLMYRHGERLSGCVLSGSGGRLDARYNFAKMLAYLERLRVGRRGKAKLLHFLGLWAANQGFQPIRTHYDWLTRKTDEIDTVLADPLFGFACSAQFWLDMLKALAEILDPLNQARIPKNLPIYIFSGARDPLGDNCRGLKYLIASYQRAGLTNIRYKFYPEGRHEMLNEINQQEVFADLLSWLEEVTATTKSARV
jgi:alpha-beta hydrolase superfamily lysophospholipase